MTAADHATKVRVPFVSLRPGADAEDIHRAIARVLDRGWFVLGPELEAFEAEFAQASGASHAVGVGNGTDALALILRGLGVERGDEVVTSPLSAAFTALAIQMVGATPVFADVDPERLTIDPRAVSAAITSRTTALLPVHLYGQAADMRSLEEVARRHNLALVEDACQAHLATANGRPVGTIGGAGAFSFYPTKNLGALGDAGAIVTNDPALADRVRRLRNGGQAERYRHVESGVNSRLDEIQAAVLRVRLAGLAAATAARRRIAQDYRHELADAHVRVPPEIDAGHVYHLFVVLSARRDELRAHLAAHGVETLVHYPTPISRQPAFPAAGECPVADRVCAEVCSLPLFPSLAAEQTARVVSAIRHWAGTAS